MTKTINTLHMVLNTLDAIEVKGKNNMDMLLGCIQTIEGLINTIQAEEIENIKETKGGEVDGR